MVEGVIWAISIRYCMVGCEGFQFCLYMSRFYKVLQSKSIEIDSPGYDFLSHRGCWIYLINGCPTSSNMHFGTNKLS